MHFDWPHFSAGRQISREAELDKVIAAERSIAYVRLGIVAFGIFILLALIPPSDPLVAWGVIVVAGIYSLWILLAEPYRENQILLSSPFTTIADATLVMLWLYSTGGLVTSTYVLVYAAIISVAYRYGQRETALATLGYSVSYIVLGILMGQLAEHFADVVVRMAYFVFVGVLSARFSNEALGQLQDKFDLRDLARNLEVESAERRRAEEALAQYAEQLEVRIQERTQELSEAKEQVETILNSTSDGIVFARLDGQIEHINPAFCVLCGATEAAILGRRLHDFVEPNDADRLSEAIRSLTGATAHTMIDVTCCRSDGSLWQAEFAMTQPVAAGNAWQGVICSLRDVTERKQVEERLRATVEQERELNALKSRFVSMVSHEYRTPLASILMAVDLLERHYERLAPSDRQEIVERIRQQIKTMTGMLENVLTIGRAENSRSQFRATPVDLAHLCEGVITELNAISPERRLVFTVSGTAQPALIDEQLIRQVVTNLSTNAIKYSPAESKVELRLAFTTDAAVITVHDSGIGIPDEDQKRLFEAFHRAGNVGGTPGTGLGLAIVKHAVDLHHGTVTIQSAVNVGTQVTVTLPLRLPPPPETTG